jgi:hypothetical protein
LGFFIYHSVPVVSLLLREALLKLLDELEQLARDADYINLISVKYKHVLDFRKTQPGHILALCEVVRRVDEMYMKLSPEQRAQWTPYWLEKYDRVGEALAKLEEVSGKQPDNSTLYEILK